MKAEIKDKKHRDEWDKMMHLCPAITMNRFTDEETGEEVCGICGRILKNGVWQWKTK